MCVDKCCLHPYGECNKIHTMFNNLSTADKKRMGDHSRSTKAFWFDAKISLKDLSESFRELLGTALGRGRHTERTRTIGISLHPSIDSACFSFV